MALILDPDHGGARTRHGEPRSDHPSGVAAPRMMFTDEMFHPGVGVRAVILGDGWQVAVWGRMDDTEIPQGSDGLLMNVHVDGSIEVRAEAPVMFIRARRVADEGLQQVELWCHEGDHHVDLDGTYLEKGRPE